MRIIFPFLILLIIPLSSAVRVTADGKAAPTRRREPVQMTDEAQRIHREAIVIDGHNDLPWQFREKEDLSFTHIDISRPQKDLHTDIPRLRKGGLGAQCWSAFVQSIRVNRARKFVNISHASAETMQHTIRITRAPLIASPPFTYALAQSATNMQDDVIEVVNKNGSLCMVTFYSGFIVPEAASGAHGR